MQDADELSDERMEAIEAERRTLAERASKADEHRRAAEEAKSGLRTHLEAVKARAKEDAKREQFLRAAMLDSTVLAGHAADARQRLIDMCVPRDLILAAERAEAAQRAIEITMTDLSRQAEGLQRDREFLTRDRSMDAEEKRARTQGVDQALQALEVKMLEGRTAFERCAREVERAVDAREQAISHAMRT
jgi:hypothetical protein